MTGRRAGRLSWLTANAAAAPLFATVALMVVWAAHDGGYDADTWYWGALVVLAMIAAVLGGLFGRPRRPGPPVRAALLAFSLYVGWSYLSIAWANSPGDALTGSNQALLYLLIFALFAVCPLRAGQALALLVAYTWAVGAVAALILIRMAGGHAASLFSQGRLLSPTGYFNSTAALFMVLALLGVSLAVRRELPALVRGTLMAIGCGGLQLALLGQSRGWLFTLPAVLLVAIAISRDRLRVIATAVLPAAGALLASGTLLDVYRAAGGAHAATPALISAAQRAGKLSLLVCVAVLILGTVLAALDDRIRVPRLGGRTRMAVGTAVAVVAIGAGAAGTVMATHGHPIRFVRSQWVTFSHPSEATSGASSHFAGVGSSRYDFWRVSLDAFLAHPVAGLGQDNFADYYVRHRRTSEEPEWTHSLELRLLVHSGLVGCLLFLAFLVAATAAALRSRRGSSGFRRDELTQAVAGIALLPLVVWVLHGSIDWFWEMPALTGPALGFLAMAGGLGQAEAGNRAPASSERSDGVSRSGASADAGLPPTGRPTLPRATRTRKAAVTVGAIAALIAAVAVLGFPYLSVREVSLASNVRQADPGQALADLATAADLNPLDSDPGRIAGTIALQTGEYATADRRFEQAISREPAGSFAWLGAGLAASALRRIGTARQDLQTAASINSRQPGVTAALRRVDGPHPLSPAAALQMLVVVQ